MKYLIVKNSTIIRIQYKPSCVLIKSQKQVVWFIDQLASKIVHVIVSST